MNHGAGLHTKRDKLTGFIVVLAIHLFGLYGLWSYRIIPPPSESLKVFVNCICPPTPAKIVVPAAPKPVQPEPVRREQPRGVMPAAPQLLTTAAPVSSPTEPVAPPPPVVNSISTPAPVVSIVASTPPAVRVATSGTRPLLLSGELSVSCSERPPPAYPKQSLRLGEQGKTLLQVVLDESGQVANVTVKTSSGVPRLDEAAIAAVKSWRCTPARRNGVAVRSVALQPFNFVVKGR